MSLDMMQKHYTSEEYHDKKKSKEIRNLMGYYKQ